MLCFNNHCTDVYFNLATEEYLLKNTGDDIFMVWQNEPSIILGKHQNIWEEVNLDFAKQKGFEVVRRYTGGGAVFHDSGNVNISFIETGNLNLDRFTDLSVQILSYLGVEAESDARRALNVKGLKVSGSAQSIHKNRVLYHATLLFNSDLEALVSSLDGSLNKVEKPLNSTNKFNVKSVKSPVTNISEHMADQISIEEFKQRIINFFLQNKENSLYELSDDDKAQIALLRDKKYKIKEWTFNSI